MGSKSNPSKWDCYAAAEPDEPMFVLLGRDPSAAILVAIWAQIRERMGEDPERIAEARACADALAQWASGLGKKGKMQRVWEILNEGDFQAP